MEIEDFLSYFEGVKKESDDSYKVLCPSHDDHNPSLHITDNGNKILIWCFAGCDSKDILEKVGLSFRDLYRNPY